MKTNTEDEKIYFYHGYTTDGYRFTIAGRFDSAADDNLVDIITLGASLCSRMDQFCKKTGRVKAQGRMKSSGVHGKDYHSLYAGNTFQPKNYFVGQETKVFLETVMPIEGLTREELMKRFRLN